DRGRVYVQMKRWEDAASDLSHAVLKLPHDASLRLESARVYIEQKRWENAAGEVDQLLSLNTVNPAQPGIYADLVKWHHLFAVLARLRPRDAVLWTERGRAYVQLQQWTKAAADFAEAVKRQPDNASLRIERGRVQAKLEQWDEVAADF